jgi:diaminohydroxyphosphoribosylaminopyrimidine deaminase/5-amino-6-(5-phosphoribosylamino)uracil reductase
MQTQAESLNPGFIKRMTQGLPYVRIKMASSLDGKTALSNGLSQWISSEDSRRDVQFLRASSSAILSTADTVIADNASLNVRLSSEALNQQVGVRQPIRVVLDPLCQLKGDEKLFAIEGEIWIIRPQQQARSLSAEGTAEVRVISQPVDENQKYDLQDLLKLIALEQVNEVHTECGSGLAGALLRQKLVDELIIYQAPCLLGTQGKGLFDLGEISIMSDRLNLDIKDVRKMGPDFKITAQPV